MRTNGVSMHKIESILHISRHTISAIYKSADSHSIFWDNVKELDEEKVFEMLFPSTTKTSVFKKVDYDYVQLSNITNHLTHKVGNTIGDWL